MLPAALADLLVALLSHFSPADRVTIFQRLRRAYCPACGYPQPETLIGCRCQRDD